MIMKKQIVLFNETLHRFHYYQYLYWVKNKAFEKYVKNKERQTKYDTLPKNVKEIYDVLLTNVEIKKLLYYSKYIIGQNVHKFDELRDFYTKMFFWKHDFFIYLKILSNFVKNIECLYSYIRNELIEVRKYIKKF